MWAETASASGSAPVDAALPREKFVSHVRMVPDDARAGTAAKFGDKQIRIWRRSYDIPPPALTPEDPRYPGHDPRYAGFPPSQLPLVEPVRDTVAKFLLYWRETIAPLVRHGCNVLILAHANSLRTLAEYLDNMPDRDIVDLNIPTRIPLVYQLDGDLKPIKHHYLGDPEAAKRAAEAVGQAGTRKLVVRHSLRSPIRRGIRRRFPLEFERAPGAFRRPLRLLSGTNWRRQGSSISGREAAYAEIGESCWNTS